MRGVIATILVSTNGSIWYTIISDFKTPISKSIADLISWGEKFHITHTDSLLNSLLTGKVVNRDEYDIGSHEFSVLPPYS